MRLNPLCEGAAAPRAWPAFDPNPAALLDFDFAGATQWGRQRYKLFSGLYTDISQVPGWAYSGSNSNGLPRYAETRNGLLVPFGQNVPRITDRGLLIEGARTNQLTYSQQFDNAAWGKTNATVSADLVVAPDGTLTADKMLETGASGPHSLSRYVAGGAGVTYPLSLYVKAAERSVVRLGLGMTSLSSGNYWYGGIIADLNSGNCQKTVPVSSAGAAANSISSFSATPAAGGWYRLAMTLTTPEATNLYVELCSRLTYNANHDEPYSGVAGYGVHVWGSQLEQGLFPTTYIPAANAPATRSADLAYVNGLGQILAAPFTMAASADMPAIDGAARYLVDANPDPPQAGGSIRAMLTREPDNAAYAYVYNGGLTTVQTVGGKAGKRVLSSAMRVRPSAAQAAIDGVLGNSTPCTAPANLSRLDIGRYLVGNSAFLDGYIERIQVLGDTTNGALAALSQ